jgi:caffeoyl-CoA O-methyltransferase
MQISPEQGALMTLLVRAIGARRALELGTFTGYSAICIARGLPHDGELVSCDVNEEWAGVARRYFEQAGLSTSPSSTPTRPDTSTTTRRRSACFGPAAWR